MKMEAFDPNTACGQTQAINLQKISDSSLNPLWEQMKPAADPWAGKAKNIVNRAPFYFDDSIAVFNRMYKMESVSPLTDSKIYNRLTEFRKMLEDEVQELDAIVIKAAKGESFLEIATDLADLLGDIQVFCASEMRRWNIPLNPTLRIIMDSNMSKLQADGTALFVDGKLQKGPNYWKPEPQISMMLKQHWGLETYDDGSNPVA